VLSSLDVIDGCFAQISPFAQLVIRDLLDNLFIFRKRLAVVSLCEVKICYAKAYSTSFVAALRIEVLVLGNRFVRPPHFTENFRQTLTRELHIRVARATLNDRAVVRPRLVIALQLEVIDVCELEMCVRRFVSGWELRQISFVLLGSHLVVAG